MNEAANSSFVAAVLVIAGSSVVITVILYWIARNLISSSHSLKGLIESVDSNVTETVQMLQKSIADINTVTQNAGDKMEKLESIVDNVEQISVDIKSSTEMINKTVSPSLGNLHAISSGVKKALETWNEFGESEINTEKVESEDQG